jgi:acyl-[acyl-carrier-protein]-phospholipid O-acyltransferase/long-chain-fatty-acid--[acyl-carrier-protein] ligase
MALPPLFPCAFAIATTAPFEGTSPWLDWALRIGLLILGHIPGVILIGAVARRKRASHRSLSWGFVLAQVLVGTALRIRYRFRVEGLENVPAGGGVILAPNHVSFLDVVLLPTVCLRNVRFLSWADYEKKPAIRLVMRFFKTIPVSPSHAKNALQTAVDRLNAGDCLGIFPEGQITRCGTPGEFQGGYALMARRANVPVVPVFIDGLWGSTLSYAGRGVLRKWPRLGRPQLTIRFGKPLAPGDAAGALRDAVQFLGAECYASRPEFQRHLAEVTVRALARNPGKVLVIDRSGPRRAAFRGATLLALAHNCARQWRRDIPEKRVGILLPPGIGATLANLACLMAGKTPVNLNFTLGRTQLEACITATGVKTFITAKAFRDKLDEKVPDFPWGRMEHIVDIAAQLKHIAKWRLVRDIALGWIAPGRLLCALWRIPRTGGGNTEAAVLCTSGSSGQPKGVPLTHTNLLGNCNQFDDLYLVTPRSRLLGNLPIFHSFGFTVTLWFPLTRGICTINTPSPLEYARNITAIREEKVTVLVGTPTFFRTYLKKAGATEMASVKLAVAGAEKTPGGFAEEWESRFGGHYYEGYGATELSPVVGVNNHNVHDPRVRGGIFHGNRRNAIGRMVCGLTARFTSPFTGERVPTHSGGVLWLKGVNVFPGYLGEPGRTREVLTEDGWYCTGDIARFDADGFLFIEGRQSRFSKIGGEMIPHGTVEDTIRQALGLHFSDDISQRIAVASRIDESKGETLVLLSTIDIDPEQLRAALANSGLSNLWIPRIIKRVDTIPVLATGKLDLQRLHQLAAG